MAQDADRVLASPGRPPGEGGAPRAEPSPGRLWPFWLAPPLIVVFVVLWLWYGVEGSFVEAGRYTLS